MKFTQSTDYALRVLMYLAGQAGLISMTVLAETLSIPYHNLTKLIQRLGRAGFVLTSKGKYGGVRLVKAYHGITLKEIVDVIEGPARLAVCLHDDNACELSQNCKLQVVFSNLQANFNKQMADITLAQLV